MICEKNKQIQRSEYQAYEACDGSRAQRQCGMNGIVNDMGVKQTRPNIWWVSHEIKHVEKKRTEYTEFQNLPQTINDAVNQGRSLTLDEIIMIMGLNGIPKMSRNQIYEKLKELKINWTQTKVTNKNGKITQLSIFRPNRLKDVEKVIDSMMCISYPSKNILSHPNM